MAGFFHGVTVTNVDTGARNVSLPSSSIIGLVDTFTEGAGPASALADPVPQALVLTAIVISFAMTALLLVVTIASRGLTGSDHVDGREDGL